MKRTPLKRKTPLSRGTKQLERTPIKFKTKRNPIPKSELAKVDERASNCYPKYGDRKCEFCFSSDNLEYAHIVHRGMGGVQGKRARIINNSRNMVLLCKNDHDFMDRRIYMIRKATPVFIIEILKGKIGWHEWYEENKEFINR
jgi:hypothetical protein